MDVKTIAEITGISESEIEKLVETEQCSLYKIKKI